MGWIKNHDLNVGGYVCDGCKTILIVHNLPAGHLKTFKQVTKTSGRFRNVPIWSKKDDDNRFCSAKCLKEFFDEDSDFADILYADRLRP